MNCRFPGMLFSGSSLYQVGWSSSECGPGVAG
jgi:hypothetical protein